MNVGVSSLAHLADHCSLDLEKIACRTIVHESVATKDERMIIDVGYGRSRGCPDVAKAYPRLRVGAYRQEVKVIPRRLDRFVERGSKTLKMYQR